MIKKLFISVLLGLIAGPAFATGIASDQSAGVRPQGLGGAFTAVADDANAVYFNPAGLATLKHFEVIAYHSEPFGIKTLDQNYFADAYPFKFLGRKMAVGGAWFSNRATLESGIGGFQVNNRFLENTLLGGFGVEILPGINFGTTLKHFQIDARTSGGGGGWAMDAGLLYRYNNWVTVGLVGKNLNAYYNVENIDASFRGGASVHLLNNRLLFTGEVETKQNIRNKEGTTVRYHIGTEYKVHPLLTLRAGVDEGLLALGAGLNYKSLSFQYSYQHNTVLDDTHRFGLRWVFDGQWNPISGARQTLSSISGRVHKQKKSMPKIRKARIVHRKPVRTVKKPRKVAPEIVKKSQPTVSAKQEDVYMDKVLTAEMAFEENKFNKALTYYQIAEKMEPGNAYIEGRIGQSFYNVKRYIMAIEWLKKSLETDPESRELRKTLISSYELIGDSKNAAEERSILELSQ